MLLFGWIRNKATPWELVKISKMCEVEYLHNLGFVGHKFSLTNRHVKSKLDMVILSKEYMAKMNRSEAFYLPKTMSDHCPLLLKASDVVFVPILVFMFQIVWVNYHGFLKVMMNLALNLID